MLCFLLNLHYSRAAMRIRKAKETDLPGVTQLWFERIAYLCELDDSIVLAQDAVLRWRRQANRWIDEENPAFFVAEAAGEIVGFVVVRTTEIRPWLQPPRIGEILEMALDLHRPHHGLSSALLEWARSWLRAKDIDILQVEPNAHYPVEEAFWRAQGGKSRSHRFWLKV